MSMLNQTTRPCALLFMIVAIVAAVRADAAPKTEDRVVASGDAVLHVRVVGKGKPVLLVPGFARGAADYEQIMLMLAGR